MPNTAIHILITVIVWCALSLLTSHFSLVVLLCLLLANLIDIDHLLKKPVYDFHRKSIGFHLLHKKRLLVVYVAGCFLPTPYAYFFFGVLLHLLLDYLEWIHPFSLVLHKPLMSKGLDRLLKRF